MSFSPSLYTWRVSLRPHPTDYVRREKILVSQKLIGWLRLARAVKLAWLFRLIEIRIYVG